MPHPGEETGARLFTCDDASLSVEAVLFRSDSPVTCFPVLVSGLGCGVLVLGLGHLLPSFRVSKHVFSIECVLLGHLLPRFRELLSFEG